MGRRKDDPEDIVLVLRPGQQISPPVDRTPLAPRDYTVARWLDPSLSEEERRRAARVFLEEARKSPRLPPV